eukprot:9342391-Alexandrium_andersonii.AAC.1
MPERSCPECRTAGGGPPDVAGTSSPWGGRCGAGGGRRPTPAQGAWGAHQGDAPAGRLGDHQDSHGGGAGRSQGG